MTGDFDKAFSQVADRLAEQVTAKVLAAVEAEFTRIVVQEGEICFNEAEAAAKLKISEETLARLRKAKAIGCSYAIAPTRFDRSKRPANGRPVYMRHHLLDYLLRHELRALGENVYRFKEKAA